MWHAAENFGSLISRFSSALARFCVPEGSLFLSQMWGGTTRMSRDANVEGEISRDELNMWPVRRCCNILSFVFAFHLFQWRKGGKKEGNESNKRKRRKRKGVRVEAELQRRKRRRKEKQIRYWEERE
jgi:hypothetical protein